MAKKTEFDPKLTWLCEECGAAQPESKDPPDNCHWCAYTYFDNLADVLKRTGQKHEA